MIESDMVELMRYYHAGDDEKLLEVFHRFSYDEWSSNCYEWEYQHAQEYSDFLQHLIPLLPTSTPLKVVLSLCESYLSSIIHIPNSVDLAANALVNFWNRKRSSEDEPMLRILFAFRNHPDGEHVTETIQKATGDLARRLDAEDFRRIIL